MANIWEKAIWILAGNLNSGLSYSITTVPFEIYSILKVGNKKKSDVLSKVKGGDDWTCHDTRDPRHTWKNSVKTPCDYFLC